MPYSDPARQRTAVREAVRRHRNGLPEAPPACNTADLDLTTAAGVTAALAACLRDVLATEADPLFRGRAAAYVAGTLLKSLEVGELETELAELRELVERQAETAGDPLKRWPA